MKVYEPAWLALLPFYGPIIGVWLLYKYEEWKRRRKRRP